MRTTNPGLVVLVALICLSACTVEEDYGEVGVLPGETEVKLDCSAYPELPFCNQDPNPGFAKFKLGKAASVRWRGNVGCEQIDLRTGTYGDQRLIKAEGHSRSVCNGEPVEFEFVYRQKTKWPTSADSWITVFRPLSVAAAEVLLRSCNGDPTPDPEWVLGSWWKANNTYAENLLLEYTAPVAFASRLLPFDDDNHEKIGGEAVDGVTTILFRARQTGSAQITVWITADGENRPLRLVDQSGLGTELSFTEWGAPFAADVPKDTRSLDEICEIQ